MSITDELRREVRERFLTYVYTAEQADKLLAIADRIDAEHERGMADAEYAAAPTEAQLSELGYVKLSVDADGVPWSLGDRDEDCNVVIELRLTSSATFAALSLTVETC